MKNKKDLAAKSLKNRPFLLFCLFFQKNPWKPSYRWNFFKKCRPHSRLKNCSKRWKTFRRKIRFLRPTSSKAPVTLFQQLFKNLHNACNSLSSLAEKKSPNVKDQVPKCRHSDHYELFSRLIVWLFLDGRKNLKQTTHAISGVRRCFLQILLWRSLQVWC